MSPDPTAEWGGSSPLRPEDPPHRSRSERSRLSSQGIDRFRAENDHIEQLKAVEKRYPGLDRVICATPLDVQLEDLDRFAKEVIPAFRNTRTAAAAQ